MERAKEGTPVGSAAVPAMEMLMGLTEDLRDDAEAQYADKYADYFKRKKDGKDGSTLTKTALQWFREQWRSPTGRLKVVPGKEALRRLRERVATEYGVTLTESRIIDAMRPDEIPDDLKSLLSQLDEYRRLAVTAKSAAS